MIFNLITFFVKTKLVLIIFKMEAKDREKEWEARNRKEQIKVIRGVVSALQSVFSRQMSIDDPAIRYCMFVDKLALALDIGLNVLNQQMDENFPDDLKLQMESLSNTVSQELKNLLEYCRSPTYNPEHPYGKKVVAETAQRFYGNANTLDCNDTKTENCNKNDGLEFYEKVCRAREQGETFNGSGFVNGC